MTTLFPKLDGPAAAKRPVTTEQIGRTRTDDYAWLKDENWRDVMKNPSALDSAIRDHLEAENAYTLAMMDGTDALQSAIFEEMKGRIKDDDSSVPSPDGPFEYFESYRPGDQHGIYLRRARKKQDRDAEPQLLLDADKLAKGHAFFSLGSVTHSPDHAYLAYSVDLNGSEKYAVTIIELASGKTIKTSIENTTGGLVWAEDSATLFWVERDENQRPSTVYRQNVLDGSDAAQIYEEADAGFFVGVGKSDASNFIEISTHNHTTSEVWLIDAKAPQNAPKLAAARRTDIEYDLHEHGAYFYILTNQDGATDFKVMRAPKSDPSPQNWEDVIAHTPGTLILGLETYAGHMVRLERANALPRIVIRDMDSGAEHTISFDEQAYGLGLMGGYEYDTHMLRFAYSSPTTPRQTFDYNMKTRERILRKTAEVPSGHNPADYKTERLSITARDGEAIPVTLIYKAELKTDGKAPCLLYGYGSYGITIPASFRTSILSLIDRGFVYAIAHIRGGMAKGYDWYRKGKLETKQATFDDFIDVGNGLCTLGYSSRGQLIAHGGSAGGLLVGAAINQDPKLFAGAIAAVPFVDVLNTMSDESLPLTPPEWPEWGNPLTDVSAYDRIASYCPYTNVAAKAYPAVLITAGLTDPRVTYWEPAKWAAKLREFQKGEAPILLKTNMDAGHQGESGRYDSLKETAFEYSFAVKLAGLG